MLCCSAEMQNRFTDWGDVRVFLAVMREGSTLAASRVLGMNQTTVSRRIGVLEHVLGFPLFDKTTRGSKPTSDALSLLADAERLEQSAHSFLDAASKRKNAHERIIRITAVIDAFNEEFSKILGEFTDRHPDVRFALQPSDAHVDVAAGDTDVAIRMAHAGVKIDPSLICYEIHKLEVSLFASRAYIEANGCPASAADLSRHKILAFDGALRDHPGNKWLQEQVGLDRIVSSPHDMLAMITSIKMGAGLGMLARHSRGSHPDLVECFAMPEGLGSTVWLLVNPVASKRKEVKAFTRFFVPEYQDYYQNS